MDEINPTVLALLRTAMRLTGASSAARIVLGPEGLPAEVASVGELPVEKVAGQDLLRIAGSRVPVVVRNFSDSTVACLAGIALLDTLGTQGSAAGSPESPSLLLVGRDTGNSFDEESLSSLSDLAVLPGTLMEDTHWATGPEDARSSTATLSLGRPGLFPQIDRHVALCREEAKPRTFAYFRLALDRLGRLNETLGWTTADLLIEEMTRRVMSCLPEGGHATHLGGGAIAMLSPPGTTGVIARNIAAKLRKVLQAPGALPGGISALSVSIGWALYPTDGDDAASLDIAARAALSEAKKSGGGHERRATREIVDAFRSASRLEQDLLATVATGGFSLNWMPVISVETQSVVALEALLRWRRPGHGDVSPEIFIPCAEDAGIIEQIDAWALRRACRDAMRWSSPLRVCVNISPVWLSNGKLSSLVADTLNETGLDPRRLQIELSERRQFGPRALAHQELSRLRALGIRVALDDFGMGEASLERLASFPVDQIKIDRTFLSQSDEIPRLTEVLRAILGLALKLSISCCAKGVETERQRAFLEAYGCEEIQGYLLGSPVKEYISATPLSL